MVCSSTIVSTARVPGCFLRRRGLLCRCSLRWGHVCAELSFDAKERLLCASELRQDLNPKTISNSGVYLRSTIGILRRPGSTTSTTFHDGPSRRRHLSPRAQKKSFWCADSPQNQALRPGAFRWVATNMNHMGYHGELGGGLSTYSSVKQSEAETAHRRHNPKRSTPAAVAIDSDTSLRATAWSMPEPAPAPVVDVDPSDVALVDLGSRSLIAEDLEKALRLWTQPAILIAGRNSLDRLPANVPRTILYLDLSFNR